MSEDGSGMTINNLPREVPFSIGSKSDPIGQPRPGLSWNLLDFKIEISPCNDRAYGPW